MWIEARYGGTKKDRRRLDQKKHNADCEVISSLDYRIYFHLKQNDR
jgi:hypothetical protein